MAATFVPDQAGDAATCVALASGWWLIAGKLTFSGSYSTGGETLKIKKYTAAGGKLLRAIVLGNARGNALQYDKANEKLMVFTGGTAPAVAEHTAAAYDSDITASAIDVAFLVKIG